MHHRVRVTIILNSKQLCVKKHGRKYTYDTQNTDKNLKVNMLVQKTVGPSTTFGDQILFF